MSKCNSLKIVIVNTINDVPSNKQYFLLSQKLLDEGYDVVYITDNFKIIEDYKGRILHWKNKNFFKSCLFFITILLNEKKIDHVVLNFRATNYSFLFYFFAKKIIITLQSDFFPNSFFSKIKSSLKFIFAHEIVTISNYMKEKLVKSFYFVANKRITVFYNSIEIQKNLSGFVPQTNSDLQIDFAKLKRLIFVGNLEYHKGFDLLISDFIKSDFKNIQLVIIGDGQLKEMIPKNHKNIIYLGKISHIEVIKEMAQNYFIILPSRKEAFGQVVIEAMSVGVIPLITRNIGASELIDNFQSGFLFENVNEALNFIEKMRFDYFLKLKDNVAIQKNNFDSTNWVNRYYHFLKK